MPDISYREFSGVRNDLSPERFGPKDLAAADNCDLDSSGKLQRRAGYSQRLAGACHSLWSEGELCLYGSSVNLCRLRADYSSETLRSDLTPGAPVSYCAVNDRVYYLNGFQSGVIDNGVSRSWGLTPPVWQGAATAGVGNLPSGAYQWAWTFLRSDGQESGTGLAESINIAPQSSLVFSDIPVSADPDVTHKRLYLSTANGEILYHALTMRNETQAATYLDHGLRLQRPLDTPRFLQGALPGHLVAYYRGALFVAVGNLLFRSEPHAYELFDIRKYLPFDSRITLIAPMEDGIFLGTEKRVVFLAGRTLDEFEVVQKTPYGAIPGTLDYAPASLVKQAQNQGENPVAFWLSPQGVCLGLNQGVVLNLTQQYSFNAGAAGAGLFRRGARAHYLALLSP